MKSLDSVDVSFAHVCITVNNKVQILSLSLSLSLSPLSHSLSLSPSPSPLSVLFYCFVVVAVVAVFLSLKKKKKSITFYIPINWCGARSTCLWAYRNLWQLETETRTVQACKDSLSKTTAQGTLDDGRRCGRQKDRWTDNVKEWTSLTMASRRRDW